MIRSTYYVPIARLSPDDRVLRRKYLRTMKELRALRGAPSTSREWRAARRAELLLASAFRHWQPVEALYRRWQEWKTAERLLYLKGLAKEVA